METYHQSNPQPYRSNNRQAIFRRSSSSDSEAHEQWSKRVRRYDLVQDEDHRSYQRPVIYQSPTLNDGVTSNAASEYPKPQQEIEPPSWAMPAKGESYLEPIGDTKYAHASIDMTSRPYFHVGRSPVSEIPLLHTTSSRSHALIFHNASGTCYITDCNSTHGTYVDGNRVQPHPKPPRKVRRGALIRFGSEGAPTFILKSFSINLSDLVHNLGGVAESLSPVTKQKVAKRETHIIQESFSSEGRDEGSSSTHEKPQEEGIKPQLSNNVQEYFRHAQQWVQHHKRHSNKKIRTKHQSSLYGNGYLTCIRGDGGGVACMEDGKDAPTAALVLLNTRINAVSRNGYQFQQKSSVTKAAQRKFLSLLRCSSPTSQTFATNATPQLTGKRKIIFHNVPQEERDDIACASDLRRPVKRIKSILTTSTFLEDEYNGHSYEGVEMERYDIQRSQPFIRRRRKIRFFDESPAPESEENLSPPKLYQLPMVSFEYSDTDKARVAHNSAPVKYSSSYYCNCAECRSYDR